jgi:hypothetical protein
MPVVVLYADDGGGFVQAGQTLPNVEGFTLSWWTPEMTIIGPAVAHGLGARLFRPAALHRALHGRQDRHGGAGWGMDARAMAAEETRHFGPLP